MSTWYTGLSWSRKLGPRKPTENKWGSWIARIARQSAAPPLQLWHLIVPSDCLPSLPAAAFLSRAYLAPGNTLKMHLNRFAMRCNLIQYTIVLRISSLLASLSLVHCHCTESSKLQWMCFISGSTVRTECRMSGSASPPPTSLPNPHTTSQLRKQKSSRTPSQPKAERLVLHLLTFAWDVTFWYSWYLVLII